MTTDEVVDSGVDPSREIPSFEEIYSDRFHDVSRWVRALGGLDADLDDLTQEIFLIVRRKLSRFDGKNLPAWLYAIAKRKVSDYHRRAWVRRLFRGPSADLEVERAQSDMPGNLDPAQVLERQELQTFLSRVLSKMSAAQRTAFVLFEIEGYSGEEIAELEGIPLNTVWTRLHHARKVFFERIDRARAQGTLP